MDWTVVVSTAITGAVGIAGVAGTLWQGKRAREAQAHDLKLSLEATTGNLNLGIDAENKRAREAEKRRVYAVCLASLADLNSAIFYYKVSHPKAEESMHVTLGKQLDAMTRAGEEAKLIAPRKVVELLEKTEGRQMKEFNGVYLGWNSDALGAVTEEAAELRANLRDAMRADLGEPVGPDASATS